MKDPATNKVKKDEDKLWKLKLAFGDDVTGIHEETFGTEATIRAKYGERFPDLYFEAQGDEDDAQILVWASEDAAKSKLPHIGEVTPA